MIKKLFPFLLLALVFISPVAQAQKASPSKIKTPRQVEHRVVVQLNTADTLEQKLLLNNLKNVKDGWGTKVLIEVVVFGPGINFVHIDESPHAAAIQQLIDRGVVFVLCRQTMKQRQVTEKMVLPRVGFVDSGVRELILKQEQGWTYLKGGY